MRIHISGTRAGYCSTYRATRKTPIAMSMGRRRWNVEYPVTLAHAPRALSSAASISAAFCGQATTANPACCFPLSLASDASDACFFALLSIPVSRTGPTGDLISRNATSRPLMTWYVSVPTTPCLQTRSAHHRHGGVGADRGMLGG